MGLGHEMYPTGAQANLYLPGHPDPHWRDGALDVAHFELMGGDTPLHIYNYARSGTKARGAGMSGRQGGAVFDDTALGNRIAEATLFVNAERFEEIRAAFPAHTYVGDLIAVYRRPEEKDEYGYMLKECYVQQSGQEGNVRGQMMSQVQLKAVDIVPLPRGRASDVYKTERTRAPWKAPSGVPTWLMSAYDVRVASRAVDGTRTGGPRPYHPSLAPEIANPEAVQGLLPRREIPILKRRPNETTNRTLTAALAEIGYQGALIVIDQTQVYVWERRNDAYVEAGAFVDGDQYTGDLQALIDPLFSTN